MFEEDVQDTIEVEKDSLDIEITLLGQHTVTPGGVRPRVLKWMNSVCDTSCAPAYIDAIAFNNLLAHGKKTTDREVGGLLVGEVCESNGTYVLVKGAVAAKHNRESLSRLTFTNESWQQMLADIERQYPRTVVVGWYHTHPGHGIFLSSHDKYIHNNFFNRPYQIAIVYDPKADYFGLFHWSQANIVQSKGIAVYGDAANLGSLNKYDAETLIVKTMQTTMHQTSPNHPFAEEPNGLREVVNDALKTVGEELGKVIKPLVEPLDRPLESKQSPEDERDEKPYFDRRV